MFDQIVAAWCRSLPADPITPSRFRDLVLLDAGFTPEGLKVVWEGERLVAAIYAVRVQSDGWIPFLFVVPQARGRGIGRALLTEALDWLRGNGVAQVTFAAYPPAYFLPGCDRAMYPAGAKLLESLGFSTHTQVAAMDRSLVGYSPPALPDLESQGWRLGTPVLGEILLHLTLTRMRGLGLHTAWFLWTKEQSPAGHLYRKAGFTTTRTFDIMRARLA